MFRRWTDLLDLDETPLEPMDPADATEGATMLDAVAHADEEQMERDFPGFKAFRDRCAPPSPTAASRRRRG